VLPLDLPALPTLPVLNQLSNGLAFTPGPTWAVVGMVGALFAVVAFRRIRRLVLFATVAIVGIVIAWNAGFLTSVS
jgi:hypothetical protein